MSHICRKILDSWNTLRVQQMFQREKLWTALQWNIHQTLSSVWPGFDWTLLWLSQSKMIDDSDTGPPVATFELDLTQSPKPFCSPFQIVWNLSVHWPFSNFQIVQSKNKERLHSSDMRRRTEVMFSVSSVPKCCTQNEELMSLVNALQKCCASAK